VSARRYWLAILGTGGTLRFRDHSGGPCASEASSQTGLSSLPAAWHVGTQYGACPFSAYVNGYLTVAPALAPPANSVLPAVTGTT
ncbi:hypothetical protein ACSTKR_23495, partial [Vibrio parahaemolyticus]